MEDLFVLGQSSGGVFSQNAMGGPAPRKGEQHQLGYELNVLPGEIRAPEREDWGGLDKRAYWGSRKRTVCLGQERLHRQKSKARRDHVWPWLKHVVWVYMERAKTVRSPACWVQSWDTTDSFAPWQAYLIHAAAGALGAGEEQPWGTLLQRLVLVTSLKCGAAAGMRRRLTGAPLWNSALCVSRFSFPALRHIKALQSRHRTHIVTSLASQRMLF